MKKVIFFFAIVLIFSCEETKDSELCWICTQTIVTRTNDTSGGFSEKTTTQILSPCSDAKSIIFNGQKIIYGNKISDFESYYTEVTTEVINGSLVKKTKVCICKPK